MHAVVLAGGVGSRLAPLTFTIPKPLLPIGDIPIVELLLRQLQTQGFSRATLSVGHLASLIQSFCGDGSQWGIPIDYVHEDTPLGTVGSLALVDHFEDDRVLVVNGDTLTDMSFADAYAAHDPTAAATVCANARTVDIDFGVLEVDESGNLAGYAEKPTLEYVVSMGANVLTVDALRRHITRGERLDMPDLIKRFRNDGERVVVHNPSAFWLDLGRLGDLEVGAQVFADDPNRFLGG